MNHGKLPIILAISPEEKERLETGLKHWNIGANMSKLQILMLSLPLTIRGLNANKLEDQVEEAGDLIRQAEKFCTGLTQGPVEQKSVEAAMKHFHVANKMSELQKVMLDAPGSMKDSNLAQLKELVSKSGKLIREAEWLLMT